MKTRVLLSFFCILLSSAMLTTLKAQDFTYKFINPAFGGDTFNYNWLLSSAQAQNTYTDPAAQQAGSSPQSTLKSFTDSFNRMVLSQLSRSLYTQQFGESGLKAGTYTLGDYQIDVSDTGTGLEIIISDLLTSDQTTISIPYY